MPLIRVRHPSPPPAYQTRRRHVRLGRPKGQAGWLGIGRRLFWSWWMWIGGALLFQVQGFEGWAVAAAAVGFFVYLITPHEHVPVYGLEPGLRIESPSFLASVTGATGVPFVDGNRVEPMNNGDEFYPAMLDAIANAQATITMEAYIYWRGEIGMRFARSLAERRRAGIQVKLLLDAIGSKSIGSDTLAILKESGCDVVWYNPLRFRTIGRFNHRNHRKSLIIDGRIAFTGGAGIADQWTGDAEDPDHWRDMQISVEGPAAAGLQTAFARGWLDMTGELISGDEYFPLCRPAGMISVQTLISTPQSGSSAVRIMYYLSIVSARKSIYIANPYFIPDDSALEILVEARQRGVEVKVMVAGVHNDMKISRYSSIRLYGPLLKAGVEVYEYNRTMMHQKTMVVDGVWSTVGTANFDNRSFALNEESNLCIHDRSLASRLEAIFAEDVKASERVTLEQWENRSTTSRVLEAACVFFRSQT